MAQCCLSATVIPAAGLVEYTYRDILLYGVFYGCLLIMVVYNALLALSLFGLPWKVPRIRRTV